MTCKYVSRPPPYVATLFWPRIFSNKRDHKGCLNRVHTGFTSRTHTGTLHYVRNGLRTYKHVYIACAYLTQRVHAVQSWISTLLSLAATGKDRSSIPSTDRLRVSVSGEYNKALSSLLSRLAWCERKSNTSAVWKGGSTQRHAGRDFQKCPVLWNDLVIIFVGGRRLTMYFIEVNELAGN